MTSGSLWVICPNKREALAPRVIAQFKAAREFVAEAKPILILARDGEGFSEELEPGVWLVYSYKRGISEALNAGLDLALDYMRDPRDYFTKWDDDDTYRPISLLPYVCAAQVAEDRDQPLWVAARSTIWIRVPDGRLWFAATKEPQGGTLAGPIRGPVFPHVDRCGEDRLWLDLVRGRGALTIDLPPEGYCYNRTANPDDQAWPLPWYGIPAFTGWQILDCGRKPESYCDQPGPSDGDSVSVANALDLRLIRQVLEC